MIWRLLKAFFSDLDSIETEIKSIGHRLKRMEDTMAVSRAEFNTKLQALVVAVAALIAKIGAGEDFQAEFDIVQSILNDVNVANPPPPAP